MSLYEKARLEPAACAGWYTSPPILAEDQLLGVDVDFVQDCFAEFATNLCDRSVDINIFSSRGVAGHAWHHFDDEDTVNAFLDGANGNVGTTLLSISQGDSLSRFHITASLLQKVIARYNVSPLLFDALSGVHSQTKVSEEGYGSCQHHSSDVRGRIFEVVYQLKYAEPNFRGQGCPYSFRTTQMYHQLCGADEGLRSFLLIFHPKENSKYEQELVRAASERQQWETIEQKPMRLHLLLLSRYVDQWRSLLSYLGGLYQKQRMDVQVVNFDDTEFYQKLNFKTMKSLRNLEERMQMLPAMIETSINVISLLKEVNNTLLKEKLCDQNEYILTTNALRSIEKRLHGYRKAAKTLLERTRGVSKLVSDALSLKSHKTATAISQNVLSLTLESVDDSAVVRVVTLATLMYLPGSFVASLFGMNILDFDERTASMRIANDFWIYLAVTTPLTALTGLAWWWASKRHKHKRAKKVQLSDV